MKHSFGILTLLMSLLLIFSCQKPNDPDTPPEPDAPTTPPGKTIEYVTTTITGRVKNYDNAPLSGAIVKAGNMTSTTDLNGLFSFNNVRVDRNAAFITIDYNGNAQNCRTMIVNPNTVYYFEIIPTGTFPDGSFNAGTGGTITNPNVYSVEFSPNSFVTRANKKPYTGAVTAGAALIAPSMPDYFDYMPATSRGINTAQEEKGIKSYGIAAIELTGSNGERLDLADGKTARFTMQIPPDYRKVAQATIPTWRLNDSTGLWKEEGIATKQGNFFTGNITSLTAWNFGYPIDLVDFKAVLKDQFGKPMFPCSVVFYSNEDSLKISREVTDSSGTLTCKVPAKTKLKLWAYNTCGTNSIEGRDIGSFSTAADLGTVTINTPPKDLLTISGSVVSCNSTPVTNGYVNIRLDMVNYRVPINNGSFTGSFRRCSDIAGAEITAYDLGNNLAGNSTFIKITSTTANTGTISACGKPVSRYLSYDMNGTYTYFMTPADSIGYSVNNNICTIWAMRRNNTQKVNFSFTIDNGRGIGYWPVNFLNIYDNAKTYNGQGSLYTSIDSYNAATGDFRGTMYGNVYNVSTNTSNSVGITFNTQ